MSILDEMEQASSAATVSDYIQSSGVPQNFAEFEALYTGNTETAIAHGQSYGGNQAVPASEYQKSLAPVNDGGAGMRANFEASIATDPETQLDIYAKNLGEPRENFGIFNGEPVVIREGQAYRLTGDILSLDTWGQGLAQAPVILSAVAGGAIAARRGKGYIDEGAAAGAAFGRGIQRWISNTLWDDPMDGVVADMMIEGAVDWTGAKLMRLGIAATTRRGLPGLEGLDPEKLAKEIATIKKKSGIDLDVAQLTNLPKLKALKVWGANYPGEAGEAIQKLQMLQHGQVEEAIEGLAAMIHAPRYAGRTGRKATQTAKAAIDLAEAQVDELVGPMYRQAFKNAEQTGVKIDVAPISRMIDEFSRKAKGPRAKKLDNIRKTLFKWEKGKNGKLKPTDQFEDSLEGLHQAKITIDEMLQSTGDSALKGTTKRDATLIKNELVRLMSEASPEYAEAMVKFGKAKDALVKPLQESVIGTIAKLSDDKAATAAAKMYGRTGGVAPSPLEITRARNAFMKAEAANPELSGSWDALTAQWLRQNLDEALTRSESSEFMNNAGKWLKAVAKTPKQRAALRSAMGPEAAEHFDLIADVLDKVARTPTISSQTAFMQLIRDQFGEASYTFINKLLQPKKFITDSIDDNFRTQATEAVVSALTDPSMIGELNKIAAMPSGRKQSIALLGMLGLHSAAQGARQSTRSVIQPDSEEPSPVPSEGQSQPILVGQPQQPQETAFAR